MCRSRVFLSGRGVGSHKFPKTQSGGVCLWAVRGCLTVVRGFVVFVFVHGVVDVFVDTAKLRSSICQKDAIMSRIRGSFLLPLRLT